MYESHAPRTYGSGVLKALRFYSSNYVFCGTFVDQTKHLYGIPGLEIGALSLLSPTLSELAMLLLSGLMNVYCIRATSDSLYLPSSDYICMYVYCT